MNVKINGYLASLRKQDPAFDKWFKEYWLAWTPPKRKVRVFLDRNLPQELRIALANYRKFRAFEEVSRSSRPDEDIYGACCQENYLLMTLDNGFWNDRRFPLARSPGIILFASHAKSTANEYLEALDLFLGECDLIGGIKRFPDYAKGMKFKISLRGFVLKFTTYEAKREVIRLEY